MLVLTIVKWALILAFILVTFVGLVLLCLSVSDRKIVDTTNEFVVLLMHLEPRGVPFSDVPLGDSDLVVDKTLRVLQIDGYVNRRYKLNNQSFDLFIAYWAPGKASQRLAAQHNPDVCWVEFGGWTELSRLESTYLQLDTSNPSPSHRPLGPIEYRLLEKPGGSEPIYTYFWQIADTDYFPLKETRIKGIGYYLGTTPDRIRAKRCPMYFIRIHSKTPMAPISQGEMGSLEMTANASSSELGATNNLQPLTFDLNPADTDENQHYLIDYPELRELLLAIHMFTTDEQLAE